MTQPVPPDPVLVEIRDLLIEIRDVLKPQAQTIPAAIPMRSPDGPRRPPPARSGVG